MGHETVTVVEPGKTSGVGMPDYRSGRVGVAQNSIKRCNGVPVFARLSKNAVPVGSCGWR